MRQQRKERLLSWRDEAMGWLKHRSGRWWLVAILAFVAVEEALMALVGDYTQSLLIWLWEGLNWFVYQPMGVGGLLLLGYLIVLLGLSWWETRPQPESEPEMAEGAEPSPEEKNAIQDIRAIWSREGRAAVERIQRLFTTILFLVGKHNYWSRALQRYAGELEEGVTEFEAELSTNRSLERVHDRFNKMYASYINVLEWIAQMREEGDIPDDLGSGTSFTRTLESWKKVHSVFTDRLKSVATDPTHQEKLNIFHASSANLSFDKPVLYKLLNEAEDTTLAMEVRGEDAKSGVDGDDQGSAPATRDE